jgi:ATP-dependent protease ClpP protease subunit
LSYFGVVNYATNERVLGDIKHHLANSTDELVLSVTSAGGPSGTAMSFYDTVRFVLKAPLVTIGSGDVDSSGMVIFLSGTRRFVTPHTTALLHPAGRVFEPGVRYTAFELGAMLAEDVLKDAHFAAVVADNSRGRLSATDVLELMKAHTVLKAEDFIKYGLAGSILQ